jgi:serine protease Do
VATIAPEVIRDRRNPLGFRVGELSAETRQVAGIDGVRIAEVDEGPGQEAGLLVGDVIVALNRQRIASPEDFAEIAKNLPQTGFIPIRIIRDGDAYTIPLELTP